MMTTVTTDKPFHIEKKRVYEAYTAVRSNRGAAGVDDQTLEQFDEDLGGNLYKIWNRMSSGSYFPPPVRAVSIPKKNGNGERILGVPTVGDRIADGCQTTDRGGSRFHLPAGLLWLPTEEIGSGRRGGHARAVLEV